MPKLYDRESVTGSWKGDAFIKGFLDRDRDLRDERSKRYQTMQDNMVKLQQERWKSAMTQYDEDQRTYGILKGMNLSTSGGRTAAAIQAAKIAGADPNDKYFGTVVRNMQDTIDQGGWEGYINQYNYGKPNMTQVGDPSWVERKAAQEDPILGGLGKLFGHKPRGRSFAYQGDIKDKVAGQVSQERAQQAKLQGQKYKTEPFPDLPEDRAAKKQLWDTVRNTEAVNMLSQLYSAHGVPLEKFVKQGVDERGRSFQQMTPSGQLALTEYKKHVVDLYRENEHIHPYEFSHALSDATAQSQNRIVDVSRSWLEATRISDQPILYIPENSMPFGAVATDQDRKLFADEFESRYADIINEYPELSKQQAIDNAVLSMYRDPVKLRGVSIGEKAEMQVDEEAFRAEVDRINQAAAKSNLRLLPDYKDILTGKASVPAGIELERSIDGKPYIKDTRSRDVPGAVPIQPKNFLELYRDFGEQNPTGF